MAVPHYQEEIAKVRSLLKVGEYDQAIRMLGQLLSFGERKSSVYHLLGLSFFYQDNPQRALPYLQEAVILSPRSEVFSTSLLHALIQASEYERCQAEYQRFLQFEPSKEYQQLFKTDGPTGTTSGEQPTTEILKELASEVVNEPKLLLLLIMDVNTEGRRAIYQKIEEGMTSIDGRLGKNRKNKSRLEPWVITYSGRVSSVNRLSSDKNFSFFKAIKEDSVGHVALDKPGLIAALEHGMEIINAEFGKVNEPSNPHFYPWMFILSSDRIVQDQMITSGKKILSGENEEYLINKYPVLIGYEAASLAALKEITGIQPVIMKENQFGDFFDWIGECIRIRLRTKTAREKISFPAMNWGHIA